MYNTDMRLDVQVEVVFHYIFYGSTPETSNGPFFV